MSKPKPVENDNWKFEVSVDRNQLVSYFASPLVSDTHLTKQSLISWGLALKYAQEHFDGKEFHGYEDGTLEPGRLGSSESSIIEMDFFELENIRILKTLGRIVGKMPASFYSNELLVIHGHDKACSHMVRAFGFDENGIFFADRRKAWEGKNLPKFVNLGV